MSWAGQVALAAYTAGAVASLPPAVRAHRALREEHDDAVTRAVLPVAGAVAVLLWPVGVALGLALRHAARHGDTR